MKHFSAVFRDYFFIDFPCVSIHDMKSYPKIIGNSVFLFHIKNRNPFKKNNHTGGDKMLKKGRKIHEINVSAESFGAVIFGAKTFEVVKDTKNFKPGDILLMKEMRDSKQTGREIKRFISFITPGDGKIIPEEYCILSLKHMMPSGMSGTDREV